MLKIFANIRIVGQINHQNAQYFDCFVKSTRPLVPSAGQFVQSAVLYVQYGFVILYLLEKILQEKKKSRIRETPTLSTDADSRTDTNLKRLRD